MKKTTIAIIAIAAALVAWFLYARTKRDTSGAKQSPIQPPQPPPTGETPNLGLFPTDSGAGQIAINKRVAEIKQNREAFLSAISIVPRGTLFFGVDTLGPTFAENIGESKGGTFPSALPVGNLTSEEKSAIAGLDGLKWFGSSYWENYKKIGTALVALQNATGVRLLSKQAYDGFRKNPADLNAIRQETVNAVDPSAFTSKPGGGSKWTNYKVDNVVKSTIEQVKAFAANWLSVNEQAEKAVREAAISQLRESGWRFVGYDAPQTN